MTYRGKPNSKTIEWLQKKYSNPLCFTGAGSGCDVSLVGWDDYIFEQCDIWCHLEYSTDNKATWNDYSGQVVYLDSCTDKKVYFRADPDNPNTNGFAQDYGMKHHKFVINGSVGASGNIQYLLTSDGSRTDVPAYCYYCMFSYCSSLTSAPALPATTLANDCYYYMFFGCSQFTDCHMKTSMEGVYNTSTHGDTSKTVIYDL